MAGPLGAGGHSGPIPKSNLQPAAFFMFQNAALLDLVSAKIGAYNVLCTHVSRFVLCCNVQLPTFLWLSVHCGPVAGIRCGCGLAFVLRRISLPSPFAQPEHRQYPRYQ